MAMNIILGNIFFLVFILLDIVYLFLVCFLFFNGDICIKLISFGSFRIIEHMKGLFQGINVCVACYSVFKDW